MIVIKLLYIGLAVKIFSANLLDMEKIIVPTDLSREKYANPLPQSVNILQKRKRGRMLKTG